MFDEEISVGKELEFPSKEIFLLFQCFCIGKDIQFRDVILEDNDVTRARIEFVNHNIIENLVVGTGAKSGFLRFMATDVPGTLTKGAPDFCSVYVILKGKETSMRSASCSAPTLSPLADQSLKSPDIMTDDPDPQLRIQGATADSHRKFESETDFIR